MPGSGKAGPSSSMLRYGGSFACGHTWSGRPRDEQNSSPDSGCPPHPHPRVPAMDPLVPSHQLCSWPGERCFLRQPWLQPLQLEHFGGGGKRNRARGGGWALGGPSPLFGLSSPTPPRQKLASFSGHPRSGPLSQAGAGFCETWGDGRIRGAEGVLPRTSAGEQRLRAPRWE